MVNSTPDFVFSVRSLLLRAPENRPERPDLCRSQRSTSAICSPLQSRNLFSGSDRFAHVAAHRELRPLAAGYLRRERGGHTLQPTALVNEAYLRLRGQRHVPWQNRGHFFAIAAREMRRVLVDQARRRRAKKRDGLIGEPVSISQVPDAPRRRDLDVLSLDEALSALAALDRRQARIVELRFFAGMTVEEIAAIARISEATVKRELSTAKVWLRHRMQTR